MSYIKDLYRDEIRDGWLVMSDTKKVWNRQLEVWAEIDRICRKHGLKYWADCGTLLGAVRHKGFIPWDDDIDLCMMRPEFNRFAAVLKDELCNGGGHDLFEIKNNFLSLVQISHSQTTNIDESFFAGLPQGITVAVFALDVVSDGTPESLAAYSALREFLIAIHDYSQIERHVQNGGQLFNDAAFLKTVYEIPDGVAKVKLFWNYAEQLFVHSSQVESFEDTLQQNNILPFRKDWFAETINLPFETVEMPAPKMFDEVLTAYCGDWRTPVNDGNVHMKRLHSADIPWREFVSRVDVKKFLSQ